MKRQTAQNFILTISEKEYAPFLYFLTISSLQVEVEVEDKWQSGPHTISLSLSLPIEFDPAILTTMWLTWKDKDLMADYARLN